MTTAEKTTQLLTTLLPFLFCLVLPLGWALAENAKPAAVQKLPEGAIGEFTIKGETSPILDSDKPKLDIKIDEKDVLSPTLETDPNAFKLNEPQEEKLEAALTASSRSSFVIEPKFFRLRSSATAYEISLKRERNAILAEDLEAANRPQSLSWNARVVDAFGKVFASFEGKGLPPQELRVPVKNAKEETFVVGAPYSGVLTYWDTKNQSHTVLVSSFKVPAFIERGAKGFIAHLAIDNLFEKNASAALVPDGETIIQELADWMKLQNQTRAPLEVGIFTKDGKKAQAQAEEVVKKLGKLLMRDDLDGASNLKVESIGPEAIERLAITIFIPSEALSNPSSEPPVLNVDKPGQAPKKKKKRFLFW